jgi:hypothetical protein
MSNFSKVYQKPVIDDKYEEEKLRNRASRLGLNS